MPREKRVYLDTSVISALLMKELQNEKNLQKVHGIILLVMRFVYQKLF